jgi:hypothetical protein
MLRKRAHERSRGLIHRSTRINGVARQDRVAWAGQSARRRFDSGFPHLSSSVGGPKERKIEAPLKLKA